jgi:sugar phosphate isomerase/epimerase
MNTPAPVSRRDFVSLLGAAAVAAPLAGAASARAQTAAPAAPAKPGAFHVFSKPLHRFSYAETARMCADAGYGGIDYTVRVPQGHVKPDRAAEDLPRAVEAAHAAGLKVEMITTEILSVREKHTETLLRAAAKAGVKYYRLGNFKYDPQLGVMASLEQLKPALRELAALNASLGLHGAIQNHAGARVGGPIWDLYELLRDIDPRWLGVQYDIRHATVEGAQSWPLALRLLAPWIRCTDLKDFKWEQAPGKGTIVNVPIGEGIVPFDAYFKRVKELGIGGPMSVHLEYPPFERSPMPDAEKRKIFPGLMRKDLVALKNFMTKQGLG